MFNALPAVALTGFCRSSAFSATTFSPCGAAERDRFGAISRQIWESPELGFHQNKSSALLQQELRANGFEVRPGVAGMPTAFTASFGSGAPVIVLLGEFDALPGLSQKDVPALAPAIEGHRSRLRT